MRKRKLFIWGIILLVAIAVAYGYYQYHRTNEDLADVTPAFHLNSTAMLSEFSAEDSNATKKYNSQVIEVDGRIIQRIMDSSRTALTIVIGADNVPGTIRCLMDSTHSSKYARLSNGDAVTIKGMFTGFNKDETGLLGSDIIMNRCLVVPH